MQTAKTKMLATSTQIIKGSNAATSAAVDEQLALFKGSPAPDMLVMLRNLQYQIDQIAATLP